MVDFEDEKTLCTLLKEKIIPWFIENGRELPWRLNYNPYHIWISEIMLQQTQMDRGINYFLRWIDRFPSVKSVADADEGEILKYWEGLGYYARARNLHKTAKIIIEEYDGKIPEKYRELLQLPGIGPYTASAVSSIAFNYDHPVLDANVERIFARLFDISAPLKKKDTRMYIEQLVQASFPLGNSRLYNQGMMDYGAIVCTPKQPFCSKCIFIESCRALQAGTVHDRPVIPSRKKQELVTMVSAIIKSGDRVFIQRRHYDDIWGGLWEFPGGVVEHGETLEEALVRELNEETELQIIPMLKIDPIIHYYTRYKVVLTCFCCELASGYDPGDEKLHAAIQGRWVTLQEVENYAFPAGHRKLLASGELTSCLKIMGKL